MDDFETFKASREKIDPSARKFSQAQWEKAYTAYRSSRERVKEVSGSSQSGKVRKSSQRRRSSSKEQSSRSFTNHSPSAALRSEVRLSSAYSDLRMMIDLLAWLAIGLVVLSAVLKLLYYTNVPAALVAILQAVIVVITVVALRLLAHVIIDIPDIALFRARIEQPTKEAEQDSLKGASENRRDTFST